MAKGFQVKSKSCFFLSSQKKNYNLKYSQYQHFVDATKLKTLKHENS